MSEPQRWLVMGASGAGKSTLARRMGQILGLPVVHLDYHYWHAGWVPTPDDEWAEVVRELSRTDSWVMDGNYSRTLQERLPYAQEGVLLDFPPWVCLYRVLKRAFGGGPRPDIPPGCTKDALDLDFIWWVVSYRWRSRPKVLKRFAEHPDIPLTVLRSERHVELFVRELARSGAPEAR